MSEYSKHPFLTTPSRTTQRFLVPLFHNLPFLYESLIWPTFSHSFYEFVDGKSYLIYNPYYLKTVLIYSLKIRTYSSSPYLSCKYTYFKLYFSVGILSLSEQILSWPLFCRCDFPPVRMNTAYSDQIWQYRWNTGFLFVRIKIG